MTKKIKVLIHVKRLFLCNVSDTGKQNHCLGNKPTC